MDPVAAALCGLGAFVIARGQWAESPGALGLFAAFYGVHRALRSGVSQALIGAPAVLWLLVHFWSFVPSRIEDAVGQESLVHEAPKGLAGILFIVVLIVMVSSARARLGSGLSTLTLVVLGLGLLVHLVALGVPKSIGGSPAVLIGTSEVGRNVLSRLLGGLCMFAIGVGPLAAPPLPRRGGAIAGAIGALVMSGVIAGLPGRLPPSADVAMLLLCVVWIASCVLLAIGLGALAKVGAGTSGWIGLGAVVFGIVGIIPAILVFERHDENGLAFAMTLPPVLLGIAIALFGWKGAPFEMGRRALAVGFFAGVVAGASAWSLAFLDLARIVRVREPTQLAELATVPIATYGLVLFAGLLVYLAAPPLRNV